MSTKVQLQLKTRDPGDRVRVALGDRGYDIVVEEGLLDRVGEQLAAFGMGPAAVVVTNPAVRRLYAVRLLRSLKAAGLQPAVVTVPDGEEAKSLRALWGILDELVKKRCERTTWLLALGGGVIGDLAGFAASVYLRGIPFVQVPTTLVAQVDASIGGKTGVNHPRGKNLIGAFYQPRAVLIDPEVLRTLPNREFRGGLAEVIKYGVIQDADFFEFLERDMDRVLAFNMAVLHRVIGTSCRIKAQVVTEDEREGDRRRILNFGHTVGHALETVTRYRRYTHGEAVAIGMVMAARLAGRLAIAPESVEKRLRALLKRAGLPCDLPRSSPGSLLRVMRQDKKVKRGEIHFVLPYEIGRVVVRPVAEADIRAVLAGRRAQSSMPVTV